MNKTSQESEVLNFFELTEEQQKTAIDHLGAELAEETQYVEWEGKEGKEALPLCMFMRMDNNTEYDGSYGLSAFSAYFIKFGNRGDATMVTYGHW